MSNQELIYAPPIKDLLDHVNDYGMVRRNLTRNAYYADQNMTLDDVVCCYKEWRDTPEHVILRYTDTYEMALFEDINYIETKYLCIKATKRGNDVYRYLLKEKWKQVLNLKDITFFKDDWGIKETMMLSITLTYNPGRAPIEAAWETFGQDFHLWLAKIRQEYGDFEYIRVWESTGKFYPHAHVVIAFKKHKFQVWEEKNDNGGRCFRISATDTKKLGVFWHSFSDIKAVSNTGKALEHLTKYLTKDLMSRKGDKTNAMLWFFGKQSYSIGKNFFSLIDRQFSPGEMKEPKTSDLIKPILGNCNKDFEFVGIFPSHLLKMSGNEWYKVLKKPPPEVTMMIWERENDIKFFNK